MDFADELTDLINRCSKENDSNTPDFILAQYIENCLAAFSQATQQRDTWYGRDARPTSIVTANQTAEQTAETCQNCGSTLTCTACDNEMMFAL